MRALFGSIFVFALLLTGSLSARAENEPTVSKVLLVSAAEAPIYRAADASKKTSSVLKRGRRVEAAGPEVNGFVPILTRSGATVWLRRTDLLPENQAAVNDDGLTPAEPTTPPPAAAVPAGRRQPRGAARIAKDDEETPPSRFGLGIERLTFDVGGSGGSYNSVSYSEFEIGLNAYFKRWLAWRNAAFVRFPSGLGNVYGLDSSVRGILDLQILTVFVGPGYRFANQNSSAPFVEGGIVLKLPFFAIGGGMKVLMDSWVNPGQANDTQIFLILAGGGAL